MTIFFLIFLQLLILDNVETITLVEMIKTLNYIIRYAFQEDVYCLYLLRDENTEFVILMEVLMEISIPTMSLLLDNRNSFHSQSFIPHCNGYIITTRSTELLTNIFQENNNSSLIKPHKRILIFYEGKEDLKNLPLKQAAIIRGMDIMIINGLAETIFHTFKSFRILNELEVNLQITSLKTNKNLLPWNCTSNAQCGRDFFKTCCWVPRFQYKSKVYQLNITVFDYKPYMLCDANNEVRDGLEYRILEDLIKEWPVKFIVIKEGLPGLSLWKTAISHVTKKSSTIALGSHWLHVSVDSDTDKSVPYGQPCVTFLIPKPKIINPALFVYQPLNIILWLLMLLITGLITCVLYGVAITYKEIGLIRHPYLEISSTILDVISFSVMHPTRYLHISPSKFPLRIVFIVLYIYSLLFVTTYLTGYASLLTYPRYSKPIRTFDDVVTNKMHWECKFDCKLYDFLLRNSSVPVFNRLADLQDFNKSLETLNYRIRENNIAFATQAVDYGYIMQTEAFDDYAKSNLKLLRGCFFSSYAIMHIIKDSPYTKLINRHISRVFENGLIPHWDIEMRYQLGERYLSNFYSEFVTNTVLRDPLSMNDMQGGFYLLFIGYFLSILAFVLEFKIPHVINILGNVKLEERKVRTLIVGKQQHKLLKNKVILQKNK